MSTDISLEKVRTAIADYIQSEGCGCCRGENHNEHKDVLAKMLKVKKYKDGSGYDFAKYRSKEGD